VVSRHRARLDAAAALGVPAHVTVGDRPAGGVADLRAAEAEVLPLLPVAARISRVWLMTGGAALGNWRTVAEFPLRP
jgi:hypothetical protein